jgi:prepilin-type N-terminal cleavage/methylation domain-containing protein/prepilin-type processing-associated H-X9-DG protein
MRRNRGFTLIELLVVVAIIALLIAILIPSLSGARERAKTAVCAASMRQTGQLIFSYASRFENRAPGIMYAIQSSGEVYRSWADVLNVDVMDQYDKASGAGFYNNAHTLYGVWELQTQANYESFMAGRRFLRCPVFTSARGNYSRYYAINLDANGGQKINGTANPITSPPAPARYPGDYGKTDPTEMHEGKWTGTLAFYSFGADLRRFNSRQFLLVEEEYPQDTTIYSPGTGDGSVTLGALPAPAPAWTGGTKGEFAFRHPFFKKANFLYFDGHVDELSPKDDVNSRRRLSIDQ